MFWIIIASFVVLMTVAILIYMMPAETAKKKTKKERAQLVPDPKLTQADKDWKAIAERWEKNNNALLGDLEKIKGQEKKFLKDLEGAKAQHKELVDKLALEKSWREKEQGNMEKSRLHEKELKDQIYAVKALYD